jgi:hypothetical protein
MSGKRTCRQVRLSKQPLALVLIQVRFSPITDLEKYLPAIQDDLRRAGYPFQSMNDTVRLEVIDGKVSPKPVRQWLMQTADRRASLVFDDGQLLMQTVDYEGFESFFETYLDAFNIVMGRSDHARLGVVQRLGLRYVDQVRKQTEDDDIDSYLRPEFRGMERGAFLDPTKHYAFTAVGQTALRRGKTGTLSIRITRNNDGNDLPPDLIQLAPPRKRAIVPGEDLALIDMDHSWGGAMMPPLNEEEIEDVFYALHDTIIEMLHTAVVTEDGIRKWQ